MYMCVYVCMYVRMYIDVCMYALRMYVLHAYVRMVVL